MKHLLFIIIILLLPGLPSRAQLNILPLPQQAELASGTFALEKTVISFPKELKREAAFLQDKLNSYGLNASLKKQSSSKKGILLQIDRSVSGEEAYRLEVTPQRITIKAATPAGIFYGVQSLLQQVYSHLPEMEIPCCRINDTPRFAWRGYMLDESRHFFGKEKVKQLLDLMAWYKMNKFHWHLTDEPGWRIEIKKYPKLATVGGQGSWSNPDDPNAQYYTQEEIREIIDYAAARHIEVIPEIDMPGHATAANRAYPEYTGGGTPEHPDFTFNVGKEEVYGFLTDILREVSSLFPTRYLHIGGDEVAFGSKAWETDPDVQAMIKREKLKTVKDAERYFMYRMTDTIKALNKTLIGWDELLDLNVNPQQTVIMWWRHDRVNVLKKALEGGFQVILCPRRPLYFDFTQHADHKWGRTWSGFCPIEDVYRFPDQGLNSWNIPTDQLSLIKGIQANAWTERIQTPERLDFMTYPRLCALAETGWTTADRKDLNEFNRRMEYAFRLFDKMGIYYFDFRNPARHPEPQGAVQKKRDVPMDFKD